MICADPRFDPKDPPETSGPPIPTNHMRCCYDPSPEHHEGSDTVYCVSCDAEYSPKALLDRARQLFIEHSAEPEKAGAIFDGAIAAAARAAYHDLTGDFAPEGSQ